MDYEMGYEKKYKVAFKKALDLYNQGLIKPQLEHIFPELKESKDNRIRKAIISILKGETRYVSIEDTNKYVTWLEKQGEELSANVEPKFNVGDTMRTWRETANGYTDGMPVVVSIDNEYYHCTNESIAIKDQDNYEFPPINVKQKHNDNAKFKLGDWIINQEGKCYQIKSIYNVDDGYYIATDKDGEDCKICFGIANEYYNIWTIQDAKPGDVLAINWHECGNSWEKIIIFVKYHNNGIKKLGYSMPCVEGYGNTFKNGKLAFEDEEIPYYSKTWTANLHPTTKEQRDLLFQTMKEAGYEWDSEKKEPQK